MRQGTIANVKAAARTAKHLLAGREKKWEPAEQREHVRVAVAEWATRRNAQHAVQQHKARIWHEKAQQQLDVTKRDNNKPLSRGFLIAPEQSTI